MHTICRHLRTFVLMGLVVCLPAADARAETVTVLDQPIVATGSGNSLEPAPGLFTVKRKRLGKVLSTASTEVNIHAHPRGGAGLKNYEYSGKMKLADVGGGIGVTFYSDYPNADHYYRLRRFSGFGTFHIAPHGTEISDGVVDTGVSPLPNVWYDFRVELRTSKDRTTIRAKVWRTGTKEPRAWQADCADTGPARRPAGKAGVWSMANGRKEWRDLVVRTR
jgi:hypothetical protein